MDIVRYRTYQTLGAVLQTWKSRTMVCSFLVPAVHFEGKDIHLTHVYRRFLLYDSTHNANERDSSPFGGIDYLRRWTRIELLNMTDFDYCVSPLTSACYSCVVLAKRLTIYYLSLMAYS